VNRAYRSVQAQFDRHSQRSVCVCVYPRVLNMQIRGSKSKSLMTSSSERSLSLKMTATHSSETAVRLSVLTYLHTASLSPVRQCLHLPYITVPLLQKHAPSVRVHCACVHCLLLHRKFPSSNYTDPNLKMTFPPAARHIAQFVTRNSGSLCSFN
jgi:hypothetical protein